MSDTRKCFLCDDEARIQKFEFIHYAVECNTCGTYKIHHDVVGNIDRGYLEKPVYNGDKIRHIEEDAKGLEDALVLLRGYIQTCILNGDKPRYIDPALLEELQLKGKPNLEERLELILKKLKKDTKDFGEFVGVDKSYKDLSYSDSDNNFGALVLVLEQRDLVKGTKIKAGYIDLQLTAKAFSILEEKNKYSKNVFVAMSFSDALNTVYEQAIKTGVENAGYIPIRVDKTEHADKICDRIIAEIKKSRFIIADFTEHKNGVYYEAGFAQGLGLKVIWTCHEDDINALHFDIQQYNCITWQYDDMPAFCRKITDRISALM